MPVNHGQEWPLRLGDSSAVADLQTTDSSSYIRGLADAVADHAIEAEETEHKLGLLVLHAIELIKHLSSVQAGQRELEINVNRAFHYASSQGHPVEFPQIDREISRRRRARLPPLPSSTYPSEQR
ncbi:hypothetical protein BKA70DRAFT_1419430 [Coprinopsis sp. MPI-PUGE-AT-0042]|nr:hypothetical protein BKA70DRAFT_1419430 [Coprinopsis sp. MPI-PUGE-AT-0042]